jgi:hypothetical protein
VHHDSLEEKKINRMPPPWLQCMTNKCCALFGNEMFRISTWEQLAMMESEWKTFL